MTIWHGKRVPHDTLWRLAMYHVAVIEGKTAPGQTTGIGYDSMSAIIALAFTVEALLNFVGDKKLGSAWKEGASYAQKIKALEARLDFKYDKSEEPFRTLEALKDARNKMAHGKPTNFRLVTTGDLDIAAALQPEWASTTDPENVVVAAAQVTSFKDFLIKRARIKPGTLFSSAWAEGE
jgi:hypothetical protein